MRHRRTFSQKEDAFTNFAHLEFRQGFVEGWAKKQYPPDNRNDHPGDSGLSEVKNVTSGYWLLPLAEKLREPDQPGAGAHQQQRTGFRN